MAVRQLGRYFSNSSTMAVLAGSCSVARLSLYLPSRVALVLAAV